MEKTVLIVEDIDTDRKLLRYSFEWHGYRILEAANGREALELALAEPPDLIISDALMPEMDGFQLLREVKKRRELHDIPFIFYSSVYTGHREEELALSLGALAFIVKPLTPEQFWEEINRALLSCVSPPVATGAVSPSDEEFLADYSRIVATKLEEKVRELQEANRRLALTETRYRNLFTSMRDVVVIADLSRTIIDANQPALRTVFGYETDEVIGKNSSMVYADRAEFEMTGREVFNRHDVQASKLVEARFRRKSGEIFVGEMYALKMVGDRGEPVGNIGVVRDITERKRSEEEIRCLNAGLEQRVAERTAQIETVNRELEAFSYSVSHDLRAPLRHIDGYSHALLEECTGGLSDECRRFLERIRAATDRMDRLIDAMLQLSHLTRKELDRKRIDLSALAEEIVAELRGVEPQRAVAVEIAGGMAAEGDGALLRVLLENLVSNAWKYSVNKPEARIEIGAREEEGTTVYFVRDNGAGFDPRYADKLFAPFQRLHADREFEGVGIGLATVKRIVDRHGGRIWAKSRLGEGATFSFTLGGGGPVVGRSGQAVSAAAELEV